MRGSFLVPVVALCIPLVGTTYGAFVPPPGLAPGSTYQILFVTAGTIDATSSDIATYNAFVNAQAALNPDLPGTTWHAVASTDTVNARDNAPSVNTAVYTTAGALLSTNLYAHNWAVHENQYGIWDRGGNAVVWTGSFFDGTEAHDYEVPGPQGLGDFVIQTIPYSNTYGPVLGYNGGTVADGVTWNAYNEIYFAQPPTWALPIYALSSPITVAPEPVSVSLLFAMSAMFVAGRRRRSA